MQSTVPDLAAIAYGAAHLVMLVGLGLIIFVPFAPGLAAIGLAVLAYAGYAAFVTQTLTTVQMLALGGVVFFAAVGQFSSWWSEKLGIRFTYITPEVLWGGFLALILASILNLSMFWQILALFVGATIAAIAVQKRGFKDALMHGPVAIYSMLGPRGFQLLMALLVCSLAIGNLLKPVGPALPAGAGAVEIVPGADPMRADPMRVEPMRVEPGAPAAPGHN